MELQFQIQKFVESTKNLTDKNMETKTKTERVGSDLKTFINNTIKDTAESHLEAWAKRYSDYKRVSQVRFDLNVNHDNSLEIEYAEEELKRKLNDKENDFLVERFHIEVCKQCKKFINKGY